MKVTLGGDRLGSGKKQKLELSHYNRASFNLEQDWKSSMAPGVLYPCLNLIGTNGDTFDIDIDSFIRTLPTKGPLFGSFKMQVDLFSCSFRLYQGILHNNPVNIGLKMSQVYLPKLMVRTNLNAQIKGSDKYTSQINTTALLKYLGLSGVGSRWQPQHDEDAYKIGRKINAIPALAYYDIFKNYYANKQEEKAYVLTPGDPTQEDNINGNITIYLYGLPTYTLIYDPVEHKSATFIPADFASEWTQSRNLRITFTSTEKLQGNGDAQASFLDGIIMYQNDVELGSVSDVISDGNAFITTKPGETTDVNAYQIAIQFKFDTLGVDDEYYFEGQLINYYNSDIKMTAFDLENIDKMRNRILKLNELGDELVIDNDETLMPYAALVKQTEDGVTWNAFSQNGLLVKTYQSDLFNNWIQTDWIEGENGIGALSSVDVSGGTLSMDALNLAQKVYDMLNRVAVTGGTYEDWQEAVYDENAVRKAESPIYLGGMSAEVMFEEVISSAETNINGDMQALGSLGGKGTQVSKNGGNNITVHLKEPSIIIGIVSLTPRICYTQGNEWYLTELDTLNDLHKPGLDGIGFQDLLGEQMAWWDTQISGGDDPVIKVRHKIGKVPAWINYTTAVDKAYGDFAQSDGKAFMVLARNYEANWGNATIKDATTYIDPSKYNYAFAYTELAAQNFWTQLHFKVIARRKMSAHQIPNL